MFGPIFKEIVNVFNINDVNLNRFIKSLGNYFNISTRNRTIKINNNFYKYLDIEVP